MEVKPKLKFRERWINQFVKRFDGIVSVLSGYFVKHESLAEAMEETYDYLFTLAKAAKVTPKNFAKILREKDKLHEYSGNVIDEIIELASKPEKVTKPKTKAKAKAKNKKK